MRGQRSRAGHRCSELRGEANQIRYQRESFVRRLVKKKKKKKSHGKTRRAKGLVLKKDVGLGKWRSGVGGGEFCEA